MIGWKIHGDYTSVCSLPRHQCLYFKGISGGSSSPAFPMVAWSGSLLTRVHLRGQPQKREELGCGCWRFTLCHRGLKNAFGWCISGASGELTRVSQRMRCRKQRLHLPREVCASAWSCLTEVYATHDFKAWSRFPVPLLTKFGFGLVAKHSSSLFPCKFR